MSSLTSYLPTDEGLLPKWLLFIGLVSLGNSIQCYLSISGSRAVYTGSTTTASAPSNKQRDPQNVSPVNELSARTFGTWTLVSSVVRLYAAFHISNPQVYEICLWTYGIAFAHFASEWLVYGSARWGKGLAGPVVVSTFTSVWMLLQWGSYVR